MDEDSGQIEANLIMQAREDAYYAELADKTRRNDRTSGYIIGCVVLIIFALIIIASIYFGG